MRQKLIVTLCLLFMFAQSCASHQRQQHCQELLATIQTAIRAEREHQGSATPAHPTMVLYVPALEARLGMRIKLNPLEDPRGGRWCLLEFWQGNDKVASWMPGCKDCQWADGNLLLLYLPESDAPSMKIYEDGKVCFHLIG